MGSLMGSRRFGTQSFRPYGSTKDLGNQSDMGKQQDLKVRWLEYLVYVSAGIVVAGDALVTWAGSRTPDPATGRVYRVLFEKSKTAYYLTQLDAGLYYGLVGKALVVMVVTLPFYAYYKVQQYRRSRSDIGRDSTHKDRNRENKGQALSLENEAAERNPTPRSSRRHMTIIQIVVVSLLLLLPILLLINISSHAAQAVTQVGTLRTLITLALPFAVGVPITKFLMKWLKHISHD